MVIPPGVKERNENSAVAASKKLHPPVEDPPRHVLAAVLLQRPRRLRRAEALRLCVRSGYTVATNRGGGPEG